MRKSVVAALCVIAANALHSQAAPVVKEYANPTSSVDLAAVRPMFDLGDDGKIEFFRILNIVERKDGSFAVVNRATNSLMLFDASGKFVRSVGRKGGGPGEYEEIASAAGLVNDTIAILDNRSRRVTVLDPNGKLVRTFSANPPSDSLSFGTLIVGSPSGSVLLGYSEITTMAPRPDAAYFHQRIFEFSSTGTRAAAAPFSLPHSEHFVQRAPANMGGTAYWNLAFGRTMTVRRGRNGILTGDGTTWSIEERTPSGRVVAIHRVKRDVEPVTEQRRARYAAFQTSGEKGPDKALAELMVKEMPYPRTVPAYSTFEVDDAGQLWVHAYPETGETRAVWLRLNSGTSAAIAVRMPERFRAMSFSGTRVLGVWKDDDGIEHVRGYSLASLK